MLNSITTVQEPAAAGVKPHSSNGYRNKNLILNYPNATFCFWINKKNSAAASMPAKGIIIYIQKAV